MTSQQYIRNATMCDCISGIALYDLLRSARSVPVVPALAPTGASACALNPPAFAGIWKRSVAAVIDFALVFAGSGVLGVGVGVLSAFSPPVFEFVVGIAWLLGGAVSWLYFSLLESSAAQATFGQRAMGIRVSDSQGRRISFARATVRYFATGIAGFGSVLVLFTRKRQALYDLVSDCVVLDTMACARMLHTDAEES